MKIAVLGASGPTGRQLVTQALDRGHEVVAVVRDPGRIADLEAPGLATATADVADASSVIAAVRGADAVVSGLGHAKGGAPDTLTQGARAVAAAGVPRIVWLSAYGTGGSAPGAGPLWPRTMRMLMGKEVADKEEADEVILSAGGTSVHAGILTHGERADRPRALGTSQAPGSLLPGRIARATVAAAMLDEAETGRHPGEVLVAAG